MGDRVGGVVIGIIFAVDDVRAAAVDVERAIGADLDEGGIGAAVLDLVGGQLDGLEPVERLGNAREELRVAGQPIEVRNSCLMFAAVVCVTNASGS